MKSLKELEEIRQKTLNSISMRKDNDNIRVVVGMATCGIAAGARPVATVKSPPRATCRRMAVRLASESREFSSSSVWSMSETSSRFFTAPRPLSRPSVHTAGPA